MVQCEASPSPSSGFIQRRRLLAVFACEDIASAYRFGVTATLPPSHCTHGAARAFLLILSLSLFSLPLLGLHHQSPREFPVISPLFSSHWCAAIDDAGSLVVHLIQRASNCPQLITCLIDASSPIVPFVIPFHYLSLYLSYTHTLVRTYCVSGDGGGGGVGAL